MPTWLKVVLIVGGLLLVLLVAAVAGLVYVAQKYGPALVEAGKHSMDEGRAYGRGTDEEGCVNEAVSRHGRAEGLTTVIHTNLFLRACLDASRPTPHFCDAVPQRTEFMKGARWQLDECKRRGLSQESQCGQLFQQVQQYCDQVGRTGSKRGTLASPEDEADEETDAEDSEPPEPPPPPAPPRSK
ncbi:MAG TPA: hypothetical protein VKB12_16210 [Pyrinomonadaceae bacterium]|nr:hypothetical protein [Pyrinomonadaceae bacterium]